MLTSAGAITTNPATAASLLKVTGVAVNGSLGNAHWDTIAIIGSDKRVYVAGYGGLGQAGGGVTTEVNSHWVNVIKAGGAALENIEKIYSTGEDYATAFYALDSNGDVWAWGHNSGGIMNDGNGGSRSNDKNRATKVWDASSKGYKASYMLTNSAGSENSAEYQVYIISNETSAGATTDKRVWFCNYYHPLSNGFWHQLTHTVFSVGAYSIQDMYLSQGNTNNFWYVLARNKSTNKLELFSAGANEAGQLGYQDPLSGTNFVNTAVDGGYNAYKIKHIHSDVLEKVIMIHCSRQYNSEGNTHLHLSDGRILAVGTIGWGFSKNGFAGARTYKFTPIAMEGN